MSVQLKFNPLKFIYQRMFTILFVLLLICSLSLAQPFVENSSQKHYLGFHVNAGLDSYREDLLVPLGFSGPGLSLGGKYTSRTQKNSINVHLKLGLGFLQNRFSHEAMRYTLEIRPSWIRKLYSHEKYGEFWGGISIPMQMNNLSFDSWDDAHLYWLTTYNLALATEWQKKIFNNYNTVIRMEIPFAGWVSRPPSYRYNKQDAMNHIGFHFTEPNKSLHFETLDNYRALFFQLVFEKEERAQKKFMCCRALAA